MALNLLVEAYISERLASGHFTVRRAALAYEVLVGGALICPFTGYVRHLRLEHADEAVAEPFLSGYLRTVAYFHGPKRAKLARWVMADFSAWERNRFQS